MTLKKAILYFCFTVALAVIAAWVFSILGFWYIGMAMLTVVVIRLAIDRLQR